MFVCSISRVASMYNNSNANMSKDQLNFRKKEIQLELQKKTKGNSSLHIHCLEVFYKYKMKHYNSFL